MCSFRFGFEFVGLSVDGYIFIALLLLVLFLLLSASGACVHAELCADFRHEYFVVRHMHYP